MTADQLSRLMSDDNHLIEYSLDRLYADIKAHPYSQVLRNLLVKKLKYEGNDQFGEALEQTSVYSTDRSFLYHYLNAPKVVVSEATNALPEASLEEIPFVIENIEEYQDTPILDENLFETEEAEIEDILELKPLQAEERIEDAAATNNSIHESLKLESLPNQNLEKEDNQLIDTINVEQPKEQESSAMSDDIAPPEEAKIESQEVEVEESVETVAEDDENPLNLTLREFIEEHPDLTFSQWFKSFSESQEQSTFYHKSQLRLKLNEDVVPPDGPADQSVKINDALISESLALILAQQGKKEEAIKMYEQLSLKNPEKRSFFAEKIQYLKSR